MISLAPLIVLAAPLQSEKPEPLFAPATEALVIPAHTAGEEWSYFNLVEDYLRVTGQQFSYSVQTRNDLAGMPSRFEFALQVPPGEVQHVFECLLALERLVIVPDRSDHAVKVHTLLQTETRPGLKGENALARSLALPVPIEQLAEFEKHPALLIETLVPTQEIEARLLANAERAMISGAGIQSITPAGDSNSLIVRGRGPTVLTQVRTWQRAMSEKLVAERGLNPDEISAPSTWPLPFPNKNAKASLLDLVRAFETSTGVHFIMNTSSRDQLRNLYPANELPNALAPRQVQEFIERLLVLHEFHLRVIRVEEPQILRIESGVSTHAPRGWIPDRIDPATLLAWTVHPAIHIRTEFSTGKVDARILSNAFRGYITNAGQEFYTPMGGESWMSAGGFGPMLHSRRAFIEKASEFVPESSEEENEGDAADEPVEESDFNPLGNR